ncbi:hypothetical protein OYE22_30590 [Streptomyces sp. 71268]|uniref:hypothetical protein n=1 Tax=Streptomyces sp. 71268 TaxID=3002640 RepID=UPI0023F704C5|nr:hypothetical protein [Streptomyces sp. 71268]WEV29050.1 hypothetical protein OYE22_30590 [Streptomyces sp. 71268]
MWTHSGDVTLDATGQEGLAAPALLGWHHPENVTLRPPVVPLPEQPRTAPDRATWRPSSTPRKPTDTRIATHTKKVEKHDVRP